MRLQILFLKMKATISETMHDLFSNNQFDAVAQLTTDDIQVINYATGQVFNGQTEFRDFMSGFKSAFPDLVIHHKNVFQNGNHVALEFEADGTHTGPLVTPAGTIPATGKAVKFVVCETHSIRDGKVASIHNYQDSASLMRQLGLM